MGRMSPLPPIQEVTYKSPPLMHFRGKAGIWIFDFCFQYTAIQSNDSQLYEAMVHTLGSKDRDNIQGIINEANRRQQANGM